MGVYNTKDELRRSELRLGIVGRGEGVDKLGKMRISPRCEIIAA